MKLQILNQSNHTKARDLIGVKAMVISSNNCGVKQHMTFWGVLDFSSFPLSKELPEIELFLIPNKPENSLDVFA